MTYPTNELIFTRIIGSMTRSEDSEEDDEYLDVREVQRKILTLSLALIFFLQVGHRPLARMAAGEQGQVRSGTGEVGQVGNR